MAVWVQGATEGVKSVRIVFGKEAKKQMLMFWKTTNADAAFRKL
jgi:hypothetical protein